MYCLILASARDRSYCAHRHTSPLCSKQKHLCCRRALLATLRVVHGRLARVLRFWKMMSDVCSLRPIPRRTGLRGDLSAIRPRLRGGSCGCSGPERDLLREGRLLSVWRTLDTWRDACSLKCLTLPAGESSPGVYKYRAPTVIADMCAMLGACTHTIFTQM